MIRSLFARLPPGMKNSLRKARATARSILTPIGMRVGSINGFLASLYFCFFSAQFRREHLAVLRGRRKFQQDLRGGGRSSPLLRRNVHRLEKGLIMTPRRRVFAEGFIAETVQAFDRARNTADYSPEELRWAHDVLQEFFQVVTDTPVISKARLAFTAGEATAGAVVDSQASFSKPYTRAQCPPPAVSFEDLHSLFIRRRSVRWYLQEPVPVELVNKAIEAAAQAPSACNRQPFRFIVSTDPEWASRIAACAGGTAGFSQQLPGIIVVIGDLSAYRFERDRHLIYVDSALASMQLMLAAETLGLATCPINWPDVDLAEQKIKQLIELPAHERIIMLVAIGYGDPEGGIAFSQKKQGDLLVTEFSPE
jgi:nitroreductase